ncbi:uncharacterized protein LOC126899471 [Daktulosphaira vitifoliae]|uniref:uncharacterized protein LOC126899471 n=1 Tax=Daktulosphaira vitifoliae TaxID=58002 RepID=UPI0021AAD6BC|nr:uncharacterized protein LOC126899471 [Daktulosphaira vitifoliae]
MATPRCKFNKINDLIDSSIYSISQMSRVYIGLDPDDSFCPKVKLVNCHQELIITIDLLHRMYSMCGYILSITENLNGILLLQDENIKVILTQWVQTITRKDTLLFQSKRDDNCIFLMNTSEFAQLYFFKDMLFEKIHRQLFHIRPRILHEIKVILQSSIDRMVVEKKPIIFPQIKTPDLLYFYEICCTGFMAKYLENISKTIFNYPHMKHLYYFSDLVELATNRSFLGVDALPIIDKKDLLCVTFPIKFKDNRNKIT